MPSCSCRSYTNGEVRGVVAFGAKRSGHEYSAEDFRLLATLTDQLALSLENGRLYEESIQAYQRVENSNRKLIEMDRVKKDFVANICHELRTPVSTIIGFSEILRDLDFTGGARDILIRLVNNSQELSNLMDNLMNFSRMEADGPSAQFEIVKLREILDRLGNDDPAADSRAAHPVRHSCRIRRRHHRKRRAEAATDFGAAFD